jgi:hypothetical protein
MGMMQDSGAHGAGPAACDGLLDYRYRREEIRCVAPAQAGAMQRVSRLLSMGSRLRGNDGGG